MSHLLVLRVSDQNTGHQLGEPLHADGFYRVYVREGPGKLLTAEDDRKLCLVVGRTRDSFAAELIQADRQGTLCEIDDPEGHFLAIVRDKSSGQLTVLRDPAGFRHAYYHDSPTSFALSSDLRWLLAARRSEAGSPSLSPTALALYISLQYVPAPHTPFAGISQLAPGEVLTVGPDRAVSVHATRPLVPATPVPVGADSDGTPDQIMELLHRSARSQLEPSARLGAFVSGGMDTSANIALLVERLGVKPLALTATFREPSYDESAPARLVAQHYGLEHLEVEIEPGMLAELPAIVRAFGSPNADRAAFAEYFLATEARAAGCVQICTGEGGDEVAGYPRMRDASDGGGNLFGALPTDAVPLARWYFEKTCMTPEPWRSRLLSALDVETDVAAEHLSDIYRRYERYTPFERLYFGQWMTWLVDGVYMKDQQVLAAVGLEPVFPFMGAQFMRYMAALDPAEKTRGLDDKNFVKDALRHSLPETILTRKKHKFLLPFAEWFRGDAKPLLHDTLLRQDGFVPTLFGAESIVDMLAEHQSGEHDHSRLLWGLLFLELWHTEWAMA